MNRLGGKSNTGEGGEDEERYLDTTKGSIFEIIKKKIVIYTKICNFNFTNFFEN